MNTNPKSKQNHIICAVMFLYDTRPFLTLYVFTPVSETLSFLAVLQQKKDILCTRPPGAVHCGRHSPSEGLAGEEVQARKARTGRDCVQGGERGGPADGEAGGRNLIPGAHLGRYAGVGRTPDWETARVEHHRLVIAKSLIPRDTLTPAYPTQPNPVKAVSLFLYVVWLHCAELFCASHASVCHLMSAIQLNKAHLRCVALAELGKDIFQMLPMAIKQPSAAFCSHLAPSRSTVINPSGANCVRLPFNWIC